MSEEKPKYNDTRTIEEKIAFYWSNVGGYIDEAMDTMNKEIANRIPDANGVINTEDTGAHILCPYCGSHYDSYEGEADFERWWGTPKCGDCGKIFSISVGTRFNFSTYK